ncbi:permease [Nocardioides flavus (ex Wang et al. 2016)]|uniref:Permease n=1 Tax=Nocardioides flavus (ex Wang et al. 2016) TaxID=2058780 RepID=A0ABQ3HJU4_9ACTN|nr:permease [Nocardioides flavus (ex Wang et al. 2016)]GHE16712.1 permease [Nocardioides flavus (ex Wang et al. 2016)]
MSAPTRQDDAPTTAPGRQVGGLPLQVYVVFAVLGALVVSQQWLVPRLDSPALATWSTIFVAIVVQSIPFLVGGVLLAGVIATMLSEKALRRLVPANPGLGVPVAGLAGVALPGCECASVPVASSLMRRGVAPAVALTFLLAAPAVNPVVLVSTAVAFPNRPEIVLARFLASLVTAVAVGWLWLRFAGRVPILHRQRTHDHGEGAAQAFLGSVRHDFIHAAGFLVLGAMIAAAINTFVPREIIDSVAGNVFLAVGSMAIFAFVVALCSEADAFVAASLSAFSDTAKLVFMVVGPAMDVKLASMESGQFGGAFALRFVPLVIVVAVLSACGMGWWLL